MRWDYRCATCGRTEERSVIAAERDGQVCTCGEALQRLPAFASQVLTVPEHFRHSLDEYGPKTAADRKKWRDDGWRPKGEPWWRNASLSREERGRDKEALPTPDQSNYRISDAWRDAKQGARADGVRPS